MTPNAEDISTPTLGSNKISLAHEKNIVLETQTFTR